MFTSTGPLPALGISPSPDAAPFWEGCERGELLLPYCLRCEEFFFYPRTLCPTCGSRDLDRSEERRVGRGTLHTFCIHHVPPLPRFAGSVPFVTAIVELEEGPRMMTLLVDVEPDPSLIHCDTPVEVAFTTDGDGHTVPVFRFRAEQSTD